MSDTEMWQEAWEIEGFGHLFALNRNTMSMVLVQLLTAEKVQRLVDDVDVVGKAYWIVADARLPGTFFYVWHGTEIEQPVHSSRQEVLESTAIGGDNALLTRMEKALSFSANKWDSWAASKLPIGDA